MRPTLNGRVTLKIPHRAQERIRNGPFYNITVKTYTGPGGMRYEEFEALLQYSADTVDDLMALLKDITPITTSGLVVVTTKSGSCQHIFREGIWWKKEKNEPQVWYDYVVNVGDGEASGSFLAPADASEETLALECLNNLCWHEITMQNKEETT